jgi:hypothetical protein
MATTFAVTANVDGAIKCTDCGSALRTGDTYAVYPSGIYGVTRNGAACHERVQTARRGRRGNSKRGASVPTIRLEAAAECSECHAPLTAGSEAKVYPNGKVYGTACHHGAATRKSADPVPAVRLVETDGAPSIAAQIAALAAQIATLAATLADGAVAAPMADPVPAAAKPEVDAFIFPKDARFVVKAMDAASGKRVTVRSQEDICHALKIGHWCTRLDEEHTKPGARYGAADKPNIAIVKYLADHPDAITVWDMSDEDPQRVDWVQFTKLGGAQ